MLVGLQTLCQVDIVGQGRTDDVTLAGIVGRAVEVVLFHRRTVAVDCRPVAVFQCLDYLRTTGMVAHLGVILADIIEDDASVLADDCHPKVTNGVTC